jgi:hypothetical protein
MQASVSSDDKMFLGRMTKWISSGIYVMDEFVMSKA